MKSANSSKPDAKKVAKMQSLASALCVLDEFSRTTGELTVTELSERLGLAKSQVSRVLSTCKEAGWVRQNPKTRGFTVGLKAYAMGSQYLNSNSMTREGLTILRAMADRSGLTSTLSILDGIDALYLLGAEGSTNVMFGSLAGSYFPAHATAPGKVLAAWAGDEKLAEMVAQHGLPALTRQTKTSLRDFKRELSNVRRYGYAISRGDRQPGIGGLSVPVFEADDQFAAALGLVYPLSRVDESQIGDYLAILRAGAQSLSSRLGASQYPYAATGDSTLDFYHNSSSEKAE